MTYGKAGCFRRLSDLESDHGNVLRDGLFQRRAESGGVTHGFQEQRNHPCGLVLQHIVHEVGGVDDQLLPRRYEQAVGHPAIICGEREEKKPMQLDPQSGMAASRQICRKRSVNSGFLSPSR